MKGEKTKIAETDKNHRERKKITENDKNRRKWNKNRWKWNKNCQEWKKMNRVNWNVKSVSEWRVNKITSFQNNALSDEQIAPAGFSDRLQINDDLILDDRNLRRHRSLCFRWIVLKFQRNIFSQTNQLSKGVMHSNTHKKSYWISEAIKHIYHIRKTNTSSKISVFFFSHSQMMRLREQKS